MGSTLKQADFEGQAYQPQEDVYVSISPNQAHCFLFLRGPNSD